MKRALAPWTAARPAGTLPGSLSGNFVQGFVAAACVSAFQDRGAPLCPADLQRVLRHAFQGGAALAAGSHAAMAVRRQDYARALVATAAGAAGVLLIERLLRDSAHTAQEKKDV